MPAVRSQLADLVGDVEHVRIVEWIQIHVRLHADRLVLRLDRLVPPGLQGSHQVVLVLVAFPVHRHRSRHHLIVDVA